MNWIISGPITVSVEVVDVDGTMRRNVCFEVPATDALFVSAVTQRWLTSFEELAFKDQQTKEA